jgi:hypothetical protein
MLDPENRKIILLALLAVAVVFAGNSGWLSPGGLNAAAAAWQVWWDTWHIAVYVSAGGIILGGLVFLFWNRWHRSLAQQQMLARVASGPTLLLLPRADWRPIQPANVQVWTRMADALPHEEHLSFEISGSEEGLAFGLHASTEGLRAAMTQFKSEWPGLHSKAVQTDPAQAPNGWQVWWVELTPADPEQAVLAVSDDPLRAMLIEVNGVLGQGRGLVQVIARRNFGMKKTLGQKAFAARDEETRSKGVRALRQQDAKRYEERAGQAYLDVTLRAVGMADTEERAQGIARGLARSIAASFGGNNPVQPMQQGRDPQPVLLRLPGKHSPWASTDLAYLAHLAGSDLIQLAPRLMTAPARYLPADPEMRLVMDLHRTAFLEGVA